jgi:uncharacterized protein YdhG (YjbR/CyaY superfamily)
MPSQSGDRAEFFPAIEKKYGKPIQYWISQLQELESTKYPEQIALLRENFEFSQNHANALVMHFRGSTSSRRHSGPDDFFAKLDTDAKKLALEIFDSIQKKYPKLELVMAWNQPMLRTGKDYVFGLSVSKNHIAINPWSTEVLAEMTPRLEGLKVNKHTFQVPLKWKVNQSLLHAMVKLRIDELSE